MIEINLLPEELRKKKKAFEIPDVTLAFLPLAVGLVVILIAVQVLLSLTVTVKERAYARFEKEWEELAPQKREIDVIKNDIKKIRRKVNAIDELMVKRILWSKKLNQLSDSMIPGIWLTKLSLDEKKVMDRTPLRRRQVVDTSPATHARKPVPKAHMAKFLKIEGRASSAYGDETATVGRFIKSLKENKGFFGDFSRIELEQMQRKTIKEIEVMNFRISCYFKEPKK